LQIIADFTGLNVVVSDTVQGNLTLRLQNVPWDQALDIILRTKGLTQRQNGNVIYVAPTEEIITREQLELESRKKIVELAPLRTEVMQINYAKAENLGTLLKNSGNQQGAVSLLSPRGQVTVDQRTNTLLIQDVPEKLSEIRGFISRLDVPIRQVMIDSRVVIANDDFAREVGIRWGATVVKRNGDYGVNTVSGSLRGTNDIVNDAVDNLQQTGQPYPIGVPPLVDRLGVNLGTVAQPFGRFALAILGQDYLLDMELSALQAEGRGEILSNPRVITTDRKEAFIKQGREIPYQVVGQNGQPIIQFRDAVLELSVTPQITPDDRIIMDISVKKDEQGPDVNTATGGSQPSIDKREVRTQVLVTNGETVVLGGILEQLTQKALDKVPLLGDIPVLGRLFQRRGEERTKRELLIFVRPQIVSENGIAVR
jgi:type IV pilus assembly protein PilQ